ncbi:SAM-dependent methyltransferase [Streptomyces huasconensis]|uniref:SAM-dependent methyltransferase n=1 Tax=Streptomyces huasconensis TaxID=1854574 RepID=UPI0033FF111E
MSNPETAVPECMPVYSHRIARVTSSLENESGDSAFHMHYDGEAPLRVAEEFFGQRAAGEAHCLLDIGCGFGGTVQHLAKSAGVARAVGVDVQEEVIRLAHQLLARCETARANKCVLACADFTTMSCEEVLDLTGRPVSSVISLNTFIHLDETQMVRTFRLLDQVLTADGKIYIEDFYLRGDPADEDRRALATRVGCPYLPTRGEYQRIVQAANSGWKVGFEDISDSYASFARNRLVQSLNVVDLDPVEQEFYRLMDGLLSSGVMGGARIRVECA